MLRRAERRAKNRRNRKGVGPSFPRYWVTMSAMGAIVAYGAFDSKVLVPAHAQQARNTSVVVTSQRRFQGPTRRFEIPAGPLGTALGAFRDETGIEIVMKDDDIANLASPGVSGVMTVDRALRELLAGTGVVHRFTGPDTVTLEVSGPTASVDVTDDFSHLSSPKYTEPILDTPQSITIIDSHLIEQQGATTLRDVLRNVPGLTVAAGEGGAPAGDNLTLRGFSARNDIFVDGVRDLSPQARDPFNLQQVEVTKGPSSVSSGRGATSGAINLVSKSPDLRSFYDFTANFGTDRTKRVTGDLNVPFERLGWGEHTAFRFDFVAHESGVAGRDVPEYQRWGVAPSLSLGLGTPTRLTLSYFKLNQDDISDYGIPWVPVTNIVLVEYRDRPAPVPRDTFYGFRDRDHEKLTSDVATIRFERDFSDALSLRNQLRFGHSTRDSIATPPRFASNDSTEINREMRSWLTEDDIWDNQTDLRVEFSTGGVRHSLVGGLAFTREENERRTRTADVARTTLFNPNPDDVFTGEIRQGQIIGDVVGKSGAAYVADTAHLGRKVQLSGGLRFDYFDADGNDLTGNRVSRVDQLVSWRVGAVYKPLEIGSIYAAYATSLSPSLEGLSYGTADSRVDPEETYTFEAGTKWDLMHERLSVTLAGFRVDKTNARTPSLVPGGPPQVLDGRQRVIGAEFGVGGRVRHDLTVTAAYTFLDSKILESNTGIAPSPFPTLPDEGKQLQNTPKHSANVWTVYETPWRITAGAGVRFVDDRYGNNANTRKVESYWTLDAMASYPITEHVDIRLNLYNLNDAYYFDRLGGGHLVPGPGRSANLGVGFRF